MVSSVRRDLLCPTSRHINIAYLQKQHQHKAAPPQHIHLKIHPQPENQQQPTSNQPPTPKVSIHFHLLSISAAAQYGTILGERRVLSQSVRDQDQLWCIGSGEQHEDPVKFVWRFLGRVFEGEHSVEAIAIFIKRIPWDAAFGFAWLFLLMWVFFFGWWMMFSLWKNCKQRFKIWKEDKTCDTPVYLNIQFEVNKLFRNTDTSVGRTKSSPKDPKNHDAVEDVTCMSGRTGNAPCLVIHTTRPSPLIAASMVHWMSPMIIEVWKEKGLGSGFLVGWPLGKGWTFGTEVFWCLAGRKTMEFITFKSERLAQWKWHKIIRQTSWYNILSSWYLVMSKWVNVAHFP